MPDYIWNSVGYDYCTSTTTYGYTYKQRFFDVGKIVKIEGNILIIEIDGINARYNPTHFNKHLWYYILESDNIEEL